MLQTLLSRLRNVRSAGKGYTAQCPAHDDRHNSLSIMEGNDGIILIKCHAGCDTENVLSHLGVTFADLFPKKEERIQKNTVSVPSSGKSMNAPIECIYPYHDEEDKLLFEVVRTRPKGFFQRRPNGVGGYDMGLGDTRRVLYHLPDVIAAVRSGRSVLLCEGEKDVEAALGLNPELCATTAPMGAGKWRDEYTAALAGGRVLLCPDNDDPGRRHMQQVGEQLVEAGCSVAWADISVADPSLASRKGADLADYLSVQANPGQALERLLISATPFLQYDFPSVAQYAQSDFLEEIQRNHQAPLLRTGFSSLDRQLGGRLYEGLYVIGSVSSMGKSAFVSQIAQTIAGQGHPVLFFSLEMSRAEMTARALTNLMFHHDPQTNNDVTVSRLLYGQLNPVEYAQLTQASQHPSLRQLSFIEGNFDLDVEAIRHQVRLHRQATGGSPVVFVDYLQILRSPDPRMTDKQAMDTNVIELKRLSRDERIPIFTVSSFNRQNYTADATFAAFKESGAIEYSADVVLALQPQGVSEMSEDVVTEREASGLARDISRLTRSTKTRIPRALEVVTLKNRRGIAFDRFPVLFYPKASFFCEEEMEQVAEDGLRWPAL